jgi:hypothetical protein
MLLLAIVAAAPLHFHFDASEWANAVYNTACLAKRVGCSQPIYKRFWNGPLHETKEDEARFNEFEAIFQKLEQEAGPVPTLPLMPNYTSDFPSLRVRLRVMAAALGAKSAADFRRRAAGDAAPQTVDRLAAIFESVEERLHPWWMATGREEVEPRVRQTEREMTRLGAPDLARRAAAFLEAAPGGRDLYVHLMPSPEFAQDAASATPALNHFSIEVTKEFDISSMASVALHELTHALYELSPEEKKVDLIRQFAASPDPAAGPLYMFLNEAVATAVQLLLLERNGMKDDDPYHDPYIPRLAQAALPLVREAFAHKGTLFEGFSGAYLAAGRKQLGADADSVAFRFSAAAVLGDGALKDAFYQQIPMRFTADSEEEAKPFARLPYIRVLTDSEARAFAGQMGTMPEASKQPGFAWIARGPGDRETLFVVGRDAAAVGEVARKLAASKPPFAEGLVLTVE